MWFVDRHPHRGGVREGGEQRLSNTRGRSFYQPIARFGEGTGRGLDDRAVGGGVGELVAVAGRGEVDCKFEVDHETLADLLFVGHHAVMGVDQEPLDEDGVAHDRAPMAVRMRSACTVSATSWVRM